MWYSFTERTRNPEQRASNKYKEAVLSQGNQEMPQLFFFGLKFADDIHYKFKSSQASKARLQSSITYRQKQKRKMAIQGHSKSRVLESMESR